MENFMGEILKYRVISLSRKKIYFLKYFKFRKFIKAGHKYKKRHVSS